MLLGLLDLRLCVGKAIGSLRLRGLGFRAQGKDL